MRRRAGRLVFGWGVAAAVAACGDPVVERGYRGAVQHHLTGQVITAGGPVDFDAPLRASIFWSTETDEAEVGDDLREQAALSVAVRFPGIFEINVFERPPDHRWADTEAAYRVGFILLYEDVDGDGRFAPTELRGGARDLVLLYVERPLTALTSPTGRPLPVGYHTARLPMLCPWTEAGEAPHDDHGLPAGCGVPVGAPCAAGVACVGGGTCVTTLAGQAWPGGYCTVPADDGACAGPGTPALAGVALLPCEDDDDCRLADGYRCVEDAQGLRGCQPGAPTALVLDPAFALAPLCAEHDEADEADEGDPLP